MKSFTYVTCCVNSTAEAINDMVERATNITYDTFKKYVDIREVSKQFGYEMDKRKGLTLKNDWAVSFYKSVFNGHPCYYMCHSMIEYIYCENFN